MVRRMSSLLAQIAALVGRRPRLATLAVVLGITALLGGAVAAGGSFEDDFTVPGIESQKAQDLLEQRFPGQSGTQATLVFSASQATLDRGAAAREIGAALSGVRRQPHVVSVEDPLRTPGRVSDDGHVAYATVSYDRSATALDAAARERLEDATAGLPRSGVEVAMSGEPGDVDRGGRPHQRAEAEPDAGERGAQRVAGRAGAAQHGDQEQHRDREPDHLADREPAGGGAVDRLARHGHLDARPG